jgi:hypothetical protein
LNSIATISGLLNANGGIAVDADKFTVADATGNTVIAGTLNVTSTTILSGHLQANGGIAVDTDKFVVTDGTGATRVAGLLTAVNGVYVEGGDLYTTGFTSYGATSTYVGFSGSPPITKANIFYKKIGRVAIVYFELLGPGDGTDDCTFTVPSALTAKNTSGYMSVNPCRVVDISALDYPGQVAILANTNTIIASVKLSIDPTVGGSFTGSTTRGIIGSLIYETDS